ADSALNGKAIYLADIERLISQPGQVLAQAQTDAQPYSAPTATAAAPVAAGNGPKSVLAVTACPTGVAHTFMAAEAIDTEAKKRGWW
ncbi:PTS fructose transporter subunit EIIBC, partial [Erwinia amylovora]|nr:PTS fructose transporter subunit EIIBC [Erwinia amylovora]